MSLVVLGTVALDSLTTPFGRRGNILGGSAAHFSMSARLFTPVNLVAVVGEDFPKAHLDFLRRKGLNLDSVIVEKGKTFRWQGEYKKGALDSAVTLKTELGVLNKFCPSLTSSQCSLKNLFLANVDPEIQLSLLRKFRSLELIGCDSMNYWINSKKGALLKLLKKVDIFVANDAEAKSLSGEHNLMHAAKFILRSGPKMALIKKGEHGVLFMSKNLIFNLPSFPVSRVVDPTGAGDTFAGGFMGYLCQAGKINEKTIPRALAYGTICASFNIEGFGLDKTKNLTLERVNNRLKQFKVITAF